MYIGVSDSSTIILKYNWNFSLYRHTLDVILRCKSHIRQKQLVNLTSSMHADFISSSSDTA